MNEKDMYAPISSICNLAIKYIESKERRHEKRKLGVKGWDSTLSGGSFEMRPDMIITSITVLSEKYLQHWANLIGVIEVKKDKRGLKSYMQLTHYCDEVSKADINQLTKCLVYI